VLLPTSPGTHRLPARIVGQRDSATGASGVRARGGMAVDELGKAVNELARLSLVELSSSGDPLAHRLVVAFGRHRNLVDNASPFDRCRESLQEEMQRANDNSDASTSRELELLIPHA
jgi:hypothetical protein